MSKRVEVYGYEDLLKMSKSELVTIYNRTAERVNRRISRAGHVTAPHFAQPTVARPRVYRSESARARYERETSERAIIADIIRVQSAPVKTVAEIKAEPEDFRTRIKVLVGQSYAGYTRDDEWYSGWVDKLSIEQMSTIRKKLAGMDIATLSDMQLWYRLRDMSMNGGDIKPIHSYKDIISTLNKLEKWEKKQGYLDKGKYIGPYSQTTNPDLEDAIAKRMLEDKR